MVIDAAALPPLPPNIATLTGPRIIGQLFNFGLFGLLTMQVYIYYISFPNDPLRNKILVYVVYLFEVAQAIIIAITVFHVYAEGFGNIATFNDIYLAWLDVNVFTGIIAFLAQMFYAYRIRVLAQNSNWVPGFILLIALIQFGGAMAAAVVLKNAKVFTHLQGKKYSVVDVIWNGGNVLCDVVIAASMIYYLNARKSRAFKSTDVIIKRVMRVVIETGALTAAVAIINLVLGLIPSKAPYYQVPSILMAKIYSNSMMAVLNSRMNIVGSHRSTSSSHVQSMGSSMPTYRGDSRAALGTKDAVAIHLSTMVSGDETHVGNDLSSKLARDYMRSAEPRSVWGPD